MKYIFLINPRLSKGSNFNLDCYFETIDDVIDWVKKELLPETITSTIYIDHGGWGTLTVDTLTTTYDMDIVKITKYKN